jgi:hypothetical protein
MRLLFVVQGHNEQDQIGYTSAARQLLAEGVLTNLTFFFPFHDFAQRKSWEDTWKALIQAAKESEPTCIFFQFFNYHAEAIATLIKGLESLPSKPLIMTSYGDPFSSNLLLPHPPSSFMHIARVADLNFQTTMGRCSDYLSRNAIRHIVFCPHGFCQKRFLLSPSELNTKRPFDISFVGSRNISKNPLSALFFTGRKRQGLVSLLQKDFGSRFALFGRGWEGYPSWHGPVAYANQIAAIREGELFFGGYPGSNELLYQSDRPWIALISGVSLIDWDVPGLSWMLHNGYDWYPVSTASQMINQIKFLLSQDQKLLQEKARLAALRAASRHSQYHRMRFMVQTASLHWKSKDSRQTPPLPPFDFFLPEVDIQKILPQILIGW